jgi:hypothetical protein
LTSLAAANGRLGWPITIATGVSLLFLAYMVWAFWINLTHPQGVDFISFWAAGKMVLDGRALQAYDIAAHWLVEQAVVPDVGLLPFPYPPPFLAFVTPFALMPFGISFAIWVILTALLYAFAAKRVAPLPYAFATPPALVDLLIGQTGLLTGGLLIFGITMMESAPFAGGALLGLLIVKPQFALMLPVAALAGRKWRVILGALVSSLTALAIGLALFGFEAFRAFLAILPHYLAFIKHSGWNWVELASPFASARYVGIAEGPALVIQSAFALAAAAVTWIAWRRDWNEKVPILAAATLLGSPYLLTYDAAILIVPAGYFIARRRWWSVGPIWLLAALPVAHFFKLYEGPNTIPLAAAASLWLMARPHLRRPHGGPASVPAGPPPTPAVQ